MSTTDFDRKDALKDLDTFFDKEQRILLHKKDLDKLQDTAKYTWSQIEQLKENPGSFEESPNNITTIGRIDAAFTNDRGKTFLFSGDEYFAYRGEYDVADAGYPRSISSNDVGFPHVNQINAAFQFRGEAFFFHNDGETFSTSQDPNTFRSVDTRFGVKRNVFHNSTNTVLITAGFTQGVHSYLIGSEAIIRYDGPDYTFMEEGFEIENNLFALLDVLGCVNNQEAFVSQKIFAAFADGGELFFTVIDQSNQEKKNYRFDDQQITEISDPITWFAMLSHDGISYKFIEHEIQFEDGTKIEGLPRQVNGALTALDDHIYLFSGHEFISIPKAQVDPSTIGAFITDWDNISQPIVEHWGKTPSLIGHTRRVDAAFVDFDKVYLFSGEEYTRYSFDRRSRGLAQFPDEGYPQRIQGNTDFLPQWARIDAAFHGFDGQDYFFNNRDQTFVTRDDLDTSQHTAEVWGKTKVHAEKPDGEVVGAAFMYENFTYLLTESEIIKYKNGDDGFIDLAEEAFLETRMKRLFEIQHAHLITNFDGIQNQLNAIEEKTESFGTQVNQKIDQGFDIQHAQFITGIDQVRSDIQQSQNGVEQGFDIHHAHLITGFDRVQSEVQHSIDQISLNHQKQGTIQEQIQEGFQQVDARLLQLSVPDLNLPLLHQVEERITGRGDGRISEEDAEEIIAFANMVGDDEEGVIDESEMKTIAFIIAKYNVTDPAKAILVAAL